MYISIRKYKTINAAEVARRVNEQFLQQIGKVPGLRGYYLIDSGDGVIASVNIFNTKLGVEESNKIGVAWAKAAAADLLEPVQVEITAGQVVAEKTAS
jgi:hypothetical protein